MKKTEVVLEIVENYDPDSHLLEKVVKLAIEGEARQHLNKKIHDITSSIRVFEFLVEKLKEEKFFQGEMAEEKIKSVERAYATLKEEGELLKKILRPPT